MSTSARHDGFQYAEQAASGAGPLEGVKILDLTRLLPGGFATAILADLGAEVIKIEQPGKGDYMRWDDPKIGSESAHIWITNRNKRSVALNLKEEAGVEALKRLSSDADVLFEGFRPGVLDRLGIGYETLREVNPKIVFCSLTGYGQSGPLASEPGHDLNYIGRAGLLSITGRKGEPPTIPGVQIGDLGGGALMACVGILAALHKAKATGAGDHVDISITDGAFSWLSIHMGDHFATGEIPGHEDMLLNGRYPCYRIYECADGKFITFAAMEPQFYLAMCDSVSRDDLRDRQFDPDAIPEWEEVFAAKSRDEWMRELAGKETCVGPVNDFAEASADEQLLHRRMVVGMQTADGESHRQVGSPIKLRGSAGDARVPSPPLGEGTRHYLGQAGYSDQEIDQLFESGAVG